MFRRSYPEIRSFFLTKVRYLVFAGVSSDNVIFSKKDRYRGRDLEKKNRSLTDCLCQLRMADLIDSLQSSQDFLRRYSLRCLVVGTIPFVQSVESRRANRMDALSHGPMTVIVLATTGLLACAFYIYVLCQWMRDTNGKRTPRPRIDGQSDGPQENKRPYVAGSRKIDWKESERIAYQKIASSLSLRRS